MVRMVTGGGRPCVNTISACCDSGAFAQTHSRVGEHRRGQEGVDTSSCLQGWNQDLTPAEVRRRHQLGLEPEKMSFTFSINAGVLSLSLAPSSAPLNFSFLSPVFLQQFSFPATLRETLQITTLSVPPPFLLIFLPLEKAFQWHNPDFLPTFLPSLNNISVAQ